jgi:glutamine synthetase
MLMAGLDGIQNKIHPGEAMDKNLYDLPPDDLRAGKGRNLIKARGERKRGAVKIGKD